MYTHTRTPLDSGFSSSELLNGRQIRSSSDALIPSPTHTAQKKQMKGSSDISSILQMNAEKSFAEGTPCYALYVGPNRVKQPKWIPATVIKVLGSRTVQVRVFPLSK